jgi:hypothetical protein
MKRRQFLNVSIKISMVGGLALSGAAVAHRLLWDYESAPPQLPARRPDSGNTPNAARSPASTAPPTAAAATKPRCLSGREIVIVRAVALRILDGAEPDPHADGALAQVQFIDEYLAGLDGGLRSDVKALLSLLELYPTMTGRFTRFSRLSPAAQDEVLSSWERSRLALLRQGLQAVKAMCFLAHYQDERSFPSLGYSGPLVPVEGLGRVLPAG